jgi:serine/threonine-protein kinase
MPATPPASPQSFGSEADPLIGRLINDRFRVTAAIGHGGMGKVYKALQSPLDRVVALKVLGAGHDRDPNFYKRFFLEASVTAKLTHPNTITLYDYGQSQDGIFFIAMEFVDGRTLSAAMQQEGPLSQDRVIHVAQQICRSLREAHGLGIIHRDLKPANVMLLRQHDDHDFVKVLDFGLVKFYQGENLEGDLTSAGTFMGSPHYIAPEQARNQNPDQRCDIYSLGVLLHHMLTGKVPFTAANPVDIILKHLRDQPPPIRQVRPDLDLHPELEALVLRCMAKDREDRYPSMDELLAHLKSIRQQLTGSGPHSIPPAQQGAGPHPRAREPLPGATPHTPLSMRTPSGPMAAVPATPPHGQRTPAYSHPAVDKAPPPPPADALDAAASEDDLASDGALDPAVGSGLQAAPIDAPILLRTAASAPRAATRRSRALVAIPVLALLGAAGAAAIWPRHGLQAQHPVFRLDASTGRPTLSAGTPGSSAQIKLIVASPSSQPGGDKASYRPSSLSYKGVAERDSATCGAADPAYVGGRIVLTPLDTGSTLEPRVQLSNCQFCTALTGSPTCSHGLLKTPGPMTSLAATVLNTVDPATGSGGLPTGHYAIKVVDGGGDTWTVPYQLGTELGGTSGGSQQYGFVTVTP